MAVNLNRKENAGRVLVAMGWQAPEKTGKYKYEIDLSAFMLGENGRVTKDNDFVFYGNSSSDCGAVLHTGTPLGLGDEAQSLTIDFDKVPAYIQKIAITVTIYDGEIRRQNFGQLKNAYVRVADYETPADTLFRFDMNGKYSGETVVVACEFIRKGADWRFRAVGAGFRGGLYALCTGYGVNAYV